MESLVDFSDSYTTYLSDTGLACKDFNIKSGRLSSKHLIHNFIIKFRSKSKSYRFGIKLDKPNRVYNIYCNKA